LNRRAVVSHSYERFEPDIASFLEQHRGKEIVVIGASRGTADEMVWSVATTGLIGAHRFTLAQLAAVMAAPTLADRGLKVANRFASEAVAARVVHELRQDQSWKYFGPVASTPGFAHVLATTLEELRLNRVKPSMLKTSGSPGEDLTLALRVYIEQLEAGAMADLADMFEIAIESSQGANHRLTGLPVLFLDIGVRSELARLFVSALVKKSPSVLACALAADQDSVNFFVKLFRVQPVVAPSDAEATTLARVRSRLFAIGQFGPDPIDDTLDYFSAPGEAMECVEVARRILKRAEQGVPFDGMAVLLRAPERYQSLLEEALRRSGVPAYFSRGVARPDPSGRAFLALLGCALENYSASRFAEYLSLGQVPPPGTSIEEASASDDEIQAALRGSILSEPDNAQEPHDPAADTDSVIAGTLQTPWQWEHLLIDAAVIGSAERWELRLKALGNELRLKVERSEGSAAQAHYQREVDRLTNLQAFAVPLIRRLGDLPVTAAWGKWLEMLAALARVSLRRPASVLAVFDELEPMADVGPVGLEEVTFVLSDRLRFLRREPPLRRGGRVFVAGIDEARGRVFDSVFIPGLAEGVFPRRVAEDPLLLDVYRQKVSGTLTINRQRREHERLLLSIALAAAAKQFIFSYSRVDLAQSRPRVPSFYALEAIRAAHGYLPELRVFQEDAAARAPSRLDRPAPVEYADAIDDAEYDLVALDRAQLTKGKQQLGAMAHLTHANETLARSLRARYSRWEIKKWTVYDGLVDADATLSPILGSYRLSRRAYSPTMLQAFAACPYRFALLGMQGLRPRDTIQPLNQMDPLTKGALFHDTQREFFERAAAGNLLPVQSNNLQSCRDLLDRSLSDVAAKYRNELAPAIDRVWRVEVEDLRTDLNGWLQQIASNNEWMPEHYELAFGLRDIAGRDAGSDTEPVTLANGVKLRGAIDLIERHITRGTLRVVDHKTGKAPDRRSSIVGGGVSLQPLLYALAAEKQLNAQVESGRLFFCTQRGNYQVVDVPVTPDTRFRIGRVLDIIDHAIASGNLSAAPSRDACSTCDCRCVCGPHEETRWLRKTTSLADLEELRNMP